MPIGFQDPWLAGSRFLFKRETSSAGTQYPVLDFGDIEPVSPVINKTEIEALVSASGRISTRDRRTIEFTESYQVVTRNLRPQTLSILLASAPPVAFTQGANGALGVSGMRMFKGDLVRVEDVATKVLYYPERIAGLYTGTVAFATLTAISRANKTLTISTDITGSLTPGDTIIVDRTGLANPKNSRSYTMVSDSFSGSTTVVVAETPAADETAITGGVVYENGGTIYNQGVDWIPYLDPTMGLVKIMPSGAIVDAATDVFIRFSLPALSGNRNVKPKSLQGEARGRGYLVWGRGNNAEMTFREFDCVVTPASAAIDIANYSTATFNVEVLGNFNNAEEPYGRLLQAIGGVPTAA